MDLVPEERAIAQSDEPEARSAARWRGPDAGGPPRARRALAVARNRARSPCGGWSSSVNVGRSPRTVEAYARSLVDYFGVLRAGRRRRRCRRTGGHRGLSG